MAVVFEGGGRARAQHGPRLSLDLPPVERGAGWEREIAPPALVEVNVCPTFLSDDAHTVGLPPRATQPSVGRHVREVKHHRDASYGSHFGLYGGVNLLPVFGDRMRSVPTVPRTHHHFGTGVSAGFGPRAPQHPTVLGLEMAASRADRVPAPSEASATVTRLAKPTARCLPREHQALFPFPRDPAGTSCPARPEPQPRPTPKQEADEEVVLPISSLMWPTPFWYNGSLRRPGAPVGLPDDYQLRGPGQGPPAAPAAPALTSVLEVDAPQYYIPGQNVSGGDDRICGPTEAETEQEASAGAFHRPAARRPLYERRVIPVRPPREHYQLDPWIGQDRDNLQSAGLSFRSSVCKSHYARHPPGPQPHVPTRRCDYPDLSLSVL